MFAGRLAIQVKVKVKVKVYSLISNLKTSDFTSYPLVTGPVHSCAISTPRRAYSPAALPAHWTHRTHCHLCATRYSFSPESIEAIEGEVPCPRTQHLNPLTAKLFDLNFHPLEVVSRWRDPQLQVSENCSDLTIWRSTVFKYCWLMAHFIFNMFKKWYLMC